ncbi:WRAP53 family protein [Megaselia abdita]
MEVESVEDVCASPSAKRARVDEELPTEIQESEENIIPLGKAEEINKVEVTETILEENTVGEESTILEEKINLEQSTTDLSETPNFEDNIQDLQENTDSEESSQDVEDSSKPVETSQDLQENTNPEEVLEETSIENKNPLESAQDLQELPENQNEEPIEPSPEIYSEPDYSYEQSYFPSETLIELSSYSWDTSIDNQQYTKGCLWSPDGTCCLVGVNGDGMHLMELPQDLYAIDKLDSSRTSSQLKSAVHVPEAGMVYDFCWYPFMNSNSPDTCLWISTRQHEPIHMWDAFDGSRRASYLGYDEADEVQAAIVVKFSDDGEKIFGGYKKSIKIFDTTLPGRICTTIKIKQAASAFALTPTNPDLITTGTWNGTINLYDTRMPKNGCMSSMFGHKAGVTLIKYNYDASLLFSGSRKEDSLFIWDMRNFAEPLKTLDRSVRTNQRVFFDLSVGGYWLASGDTDGVLRLWNTTDGEYENERKVNVFFFCKSVF